MGRARRLGGSETVFGGWRALGSLGVVRSLIEVVVFFAAAVAVLYVGIVELEGLVGLVLCALAALALLGRAMFGAAEVVLWRKARVGRRSGAPEGGMVAPVVGAGRWMRRSLRGAAVALFVSALYVGTSGHDRPSRLVLLLALSVGAADCVLGVRDALSRSS